MEEAVAAARIEWHCNEHASQWLIFLSAFYEAHLLDVMGLDDGWKATSIAIKDGGKISVFQICQE